MSTPSQGLPNRHQLLEDLHDQASEDDDGPRHLALAEVIDALKMSDTVRVLGVGVIEDLMREATRVISVNLGPGTQVYHVGAAQFAWVTPFSQDDRALESELNKLIVQLNNHLSSAPVRISLNPVIGFATLEDGQNPGEDAIRMAHNAAQEARLTGQSVSTYSMAADDHHQRRFRLLSDMRTALISGQELSLVYQPRIDLSTGACIGAEALLRWKHPELGAVSPGEFIPLVEQTDLAGPLTAWVIAEAIRQIVAWRAMAIDLAISVNVSVANLDQRILRPTSSNNYKRPISIRRPSRLKSPRALSSRTARMSRSSFGRSKPRAFAWRSTISEQVQQPLIPEALTADLVKIDQSFVHDLAEDPKGQMLVRHLIEMSRGLGFRVVAEGVEDRESYEILRSWRCEKHRATGWRDHLCQLIYRNG